MRILLPFASDTGAIVASHMLPIPQKGKGVFTTIKVVEKIPLFLQKHLKRLQQHAAQSNIPVFLDIKYLLPQIQQVLQANKKETCAIRISIVKNHFFIHATDLPQNGKPINVISLEDRRGSEKTIKGIDRRIYTKVLEAACLQNAQDCLFVSCGTLVESTIANIFSLNKKGQIITPQIHGKGLCGIAREVVMEQVQVAKQDIPVTTDGPLVLTNSLRVQKIQRLNGKALKNPDRLFEKIHTALRKAEAVYIKKYTIQDNI